MGTGSAGAGGSGAGGGGSGTGDGEGLGGLGHLHFDPTSGPPSSTLQAGSSGESLPAVARQRVIEVLRAPTRRGYLCRQLCSTPSREAYALVAVMANDPCRLDSEPTSGFLYRHMQQLGEAWNEVESDERFRNAARSALEEFIFDLLGDAIQVYLKGDCEAVRDALDQEVRATAAQHFLGTFLWKILEREIERLPDDDTKLLQDTCRAVADEMVDKLVEASEDDAGEPVAGVLSRMCELVVGDEPFVGWFLGQLVP